MARGAVHRRHATNNPNRTIGIGSTLILYVIAWAMKGESHKASSLLCDAVGLATEAGRTSGTVTVRRRTANAARRARERPFSSDFVEAKSFVPVNHFTANPHSLNLVSVSSFKGLAWVFTPILPWVLSPANWVIKLVIWRMPPSISVTWNGGAAIAPLLIVAALGIKIIIITMPLKMPTTMPKLKYKELDVKGA